MVMPDRPPAAAIPVRHQHLIIKEYRCRPCGRLLFRASLPPESQGLEIQIRCPKCGHMSVYPEPNGHGPSKGATNDIDRHAKQDERPADR